MDLDDLLSQMDPEAKLLEPREFFDKAIVDVTDDPKDHWPRTTNMVVAVYDETKCIEAIMEWLECDYDAALDWYSYNTTGAWVGPGTPTFRSDETSTEDEGEAP